MPYSAITPYLNTIPPERQAPHPGDRAQDPLADTLERARHRAPRQQGELGAGGHTASFQSAAALYDIRCGKGGERREVPIRRELAQLLQLHIDHRRDGPLFTGRQASKGDRSRVLHRAAGRANRPRGRSAAGITKRVYPHLLRHTGATRLLTLGMEITDVQRFFGHEDLATTRRYAETTAALLRRKFDQLINPTAQTLVAAVQDRRGEEAAVLVAQLLTARRRGRLISAGA